MSAVRANRTSHQSFTETLSDNDTLWKAQTGRLTVYAHWRNVGFALGWADDCPIEPDKMPESPNALLEAVAALVLTTKSTGQVDYANRGWKEFTGLELSETVGLGWETSLHPDDLPAAQQSCRAVFQGAPVSRLKARVRRSDGQYREIMFHLSPLPKGDDGLPACCWLGVEVADGSPASASSEDGSGGEPAPVAGVKALLQLFFEESPLSMFIKDLSGRYVLINAQAEKLFSATNQHVRGQAVDAFYPADLAAAVHMDDNRVIQSEDVVRHEWLIPTGSESRWFAANKFAIRDRNGTPVGIGGIDADIHEQKRLEEAHREAGLLLRAVIDAVPAVIAVRDTNGRFVLVNRSFADLIGIAPEDCVGKTPVEIGGWQIMERLLGMQLPMTVDGRWGEFSEVETKLVDDEARAWLINSVPVFSKTAVSHIVSVAIDITLRKRAEEAILASKEAAEHANLAKSSFLAAASHDLRQPLQALNLFVNALDRRVRSGSGRVILGDIRECLGAMGGLLNALLDISQLEAGTIQPKFTTVHIQNVFDQLAREYLPVTAEKGLTLRFIRSRMVVRSDATLLRTIVANLLANAIRYTVAGRIVVGIRRTGSQGASIEVHDTGIGIDPDHVERIFEDFYQVGGAATDRSRGLGLGLSIARRLATLLEHRIGVRSRPGRGSCFALSALRVAMDLDRPASEPVLAKRHAFAKRHVLILENDRTVSAALCTTLTDWGAIASAAATIDAALAIADARSPDVVIADYQLDAGDTGLDGLVAIERRLGRRLPAIILSGDMSADDLRSMRDSGYYTLSKPVQSGRLRALLDVCLAAVRAAPRS